MKAPILVVNAFTFTDHSAFTLAMQKLWHAHVKNARNFDWLCFRRVLIFTLSRRGGGAAEKGEVVFNAVPASPRVIQLG
jgi:hypothetical protein